MDATQPVLRITIKDLVLEIEGEQSVQQLGASLKALLSQISSNSLEEFAGSTAKPQKRRGRPPKAGAAGAKPAAPGRKRRPRSDAATARIRQLGAEQFFDVPRRASEVKAALSDTGYVMDNRQVYATLKYMADKGILQRAQAGEDGNWTYRLAASGI